MRVQYTMIVVILLLLLLLLPSVAFPFYRIELENNSAFTTSQYREEGDQIFFYSYGGIVGIQKDFVRNITELDLEDADLAEPQELSRQSKTKAAVSSTADAEDKTEKITGKEPKKRSLKVDLTAYKTKKIEITKKFNSAKARLRQATKNRDRVAQKSASAEVWEIEKQRSKLAKEIKEKNNGVLPLWWQRDEKVNPEAAKSPD